MCQDSLVGLEAPDSCCYGPAGAGGKAHYYDITTEELRYGYACDAIRARDYPRADLTVRRGVCNHSEYSSSI